MQNVTGNPVDGTDFCGRDDELRQLRDSVEAGNHVLLVGPRRVGKSSIVAELSRRLIAEGWTVVKVDVQNAADEAAFLHEIHEAVRKTGVTQSLLDEATRFINGFRQAFRVKKVSGPGGIGVEIGDGQADWESAATSLKNLILMLPEQFKRVLITLDELPIFLTKLSEQSDATKRVRSILDWLRSVRQASGRKLPWIMCGSIGLDSFVAKHGLEGSINELLPQLVDAYEVPQAIDLLIRLGQSTKEQCVLSDNVANAIVAKAGWPIPYYLQLLFHGLKNLPTSKRSAKYPDRIDVDEAYESLLDLNHRSHFGHWDSRLGDLLETGQARMARELLNHLSGHPAGQSRDQLRAILARNYPSADAQKLDRELRNLLEFLERDGYLGRSVQQYAFRSFLLRDFWNRRIAN